jgi:hypothetical protein
MPLTSIYRLFFIPLLLHPLHGKAQQSELLTPSQVAAIITDSVKTEFKIAYPIFRVYHYTDRSGQYYCVLTESDDSVVKNGDDKDTISHALKAVDLKLDQGKLTKAWEINDHIIKNENEETTIRFMTRFSEFKDYDGDGIIEPLIIYGTRGANGYEDGRIKFILYYKGRKFAMRYQGSTFDGQRSEEYDANMPKPLEDAFQRKMQEISKALQITI